jgi:hypothetical protein
MRQGGQKLGSRVAYWSFIAACAACGPNRAPTPTPAPASIQVDVRLEPDEADAALTILDTRLRGATPTPTDWERLFSADGYQHLKEREAAMGRSFTDSAFTAFLMSDTLLRRAPALARILPSLERLDVSAATARALTYLPAGTPLRARLYLEIKPRTNSFVFTGRDSVPSIFLYVKPDQSPAQLENTLAHELHHIGLNRACPEPSFARATPAQRMLLWFLGAFGEGQAMLAAAGSASIHPHALDDDSVRTRWDRDVSHAPADIAELSRFFVAVLDGRMTSADSVRDQAFTYYGVQGPWYTVGWLMASTIEREFGRDRLVGSICDPTRFIATYQGAAKQANRRGASLPLWDQDLVGRLLTLRRQAI